VLDLDLDILNGRRERSTGSEISMEADLQSIAAAGAATLVVGSRDQRGQLGWAGQVG
jgi:hypothetical protein